MVNENCPVIMDTLKKNLKRFKKIPIHVVEEHNEALQFIYSAIGGNRLPVEGTALLHLDAHPDMLIDRKLKGSEARSGRKVLPLLQIENWIVPAAAAGHIERVIWLRPPWARQFIDGTRAIHVGDHPTTGLLRTDSTEPYYMSDALYSSQLINKKRFEFTVSELSQTNLDAISKLSKSLNASPYVLDIDLDFFSTGNPFLDLYKDINLYNLLEPIFSFQLPVDNDEITLKKFNEAREKQLNELEVLFECLEKDGNLKHYTGPETELYMKVRGLLDIVTSEAKRLSEPPDWWAIFAAGCTRDQGGLPHHISSEEEIRNTIENTLKPFLHQLPPPTLITIARSTDDGYCPSHQVNFIQTLVLNVLKDVFDSDDPVMHYLNSD